MASAEGESWEVKRLSQRSLRKAAEVAERNIVVS